MGNYEKVKAWRQRQPNLREKRAEEARKWRAAHPETAKAIKVRYLDRTREERLPKEAEQARKRRAADPIGQRIRMERWKAKREQRQEQEAGRPRPDSCEVCGELNIRIVFDHCHKNGHFRGWICDRCNRVLGLIKDSPGLLRSLARYLENGKTNDHRAQESAFERFRPLGKTLPN